MKILELTYSKLDRKSNYQGSFHEKVEAKCSVGGDEDASEAFEKLKKFVQCKMGACTCPKACQPEERHA